VRTELWRSTRPLHCLAISFVTESCTVFVYLKSPIFRLPTDAPPNLNGIELAQGLAVDTYVSSG
jgi:hypothetical protein